MTIKIPSPISKSQGCGQTVEWFSFTFTPRSSSVLSSCWDQGAAKQSPHFQTRAHPSEQGRDFCTEPVWPFIKTFEINSIYRHLKNSYRQIQLARQEMFMEIELGLTCEQLCPKKTGLALSWSFPTERSPGWAPDAISTALLCTGITQAAPLPNQLWSWALLFTEGHFLLLVSRIYCHWSTPQPSEEKGDLPCILPTALKGNNQGLYP